MTIKALIFDLEGVLLTTTEENIEVSLAKRLNIPVESVGTIFHGEFNDRVDKGEFTQRDFWLHALDQLDLPHNRLPEMEAFFAEDFFIDPEMLAYIRDYHKEYKTALLSNYSEVLRPLLNTRWNLDGAFDEIIISCEVKMIKPDPAIFQYTLDKLGVEKDEAVLIDDRIVNINGARAFGLHAVHFQKKSQAIEELNNTLAKFCAIDICIE